MKIKFWILVLFLAVVVLKSQSQVVGCYTLPGGDAMSATHLTILPDSFYVFSYFGGMDIGKWKLKTDSLLELTRADFYEDEFIVYGRKSSEVKKDSTSLQFSGCENGATAISFDNDTIQRLKFYPIFNKDANCFESSIKKNIPKASQIHLFSQPENFYSEPSFIDQVIDKKKIQTFDFPDQFNQFLIVFNEKAKSGFKTIHMILSKKGDLIPIEGGGTFRRTRNIDEMSDSDKKFCQGISEVFKNAGGQDRDVYVKQDGNGSQKIRFYKITKTKEYRKKIVVDTKHPVIISICDHSSENMSVPEGQTSERRSYR